ncbi:hypothetical protein LA080_012496 [Diaporthe eres]|uniref:Tat pathway signal sequence n=1 Tax=Diaporthe vaccinii TaxID=105482 RepID=A0ABR4E1V7_9PEZI|nr:hypothetical protein LA080_012496 [Diaporthe eres]
MASEKGRYQPLRDQSSFSSDDDGIQCHDGSPQSRLWHRRFSTSTVALSIFCVILLAVSSVQAWVIVKLERRLVHPHTRLSREYNVPLLANNHSAFDSPSNAISDVAWASIEAGHGDVLLTRSEAASLGLPPSFEHPFRPGYQVYIIDAYHAMHCLKVLRDHYMRMYHAHRYVDDWPQLGDWPLEHDEHCFDSLRQHVMCHADDTLLYSTGHHDAGVRQTKMCRSWDALREWASERNAQWKDHINPRPEGEIWWNFDDGGDDGLPQGGLS